MSLADLIAARAATNGADVALRSVDRQLSYADVGAAAGRIAGQLHAHDMAADDLVGLYLPRSADLAVAAVGVLWAGAAYLPIDLSTPPRRLAEMIAIAGPRCVITNRRGSAGVSSLAESAGVPVIPLDDHASSDIAVRPRESHPEDLAYVVFTSGSTGEPKPVAVPRRAMGNHAAAIAKRYELTQTDRVLQFANAAFDVFAEELFPALTVGARVVLAPEEVLSPAQLVEFIREHGITVVNLPTPYWTQWTRELEPEMIPPRLRLVVIGSEAGHADALTRWYENASVPVVNSYGLSETTITNISARLDKGTRLDPLPIGHPIDGVEALVLDTELRPAPEGELYIGGAALARGYLGRGDLTAERFIPHPVTPGARLYRTGDLVRVVPGHGLQYLGRTDRQVKIRGHRVEPLQIEAALTSHPDVLQAHVRLAGDQLVAYLVPRDPHRVPTMRAIRTHLRDRLPGYMHPNAVVLLDAMPLSPNGKVDNARLPAPDRRRRPDAEYVAPAAGIQERIAAVWCELLGLDRVGITDDLFELGGHSLTATRISAAIYQRERVEVSPTEVLNTPSIASLAELVASRVDQPPALPPLSGTRRDRAPLSLQQEQVLFLTRLAPDSIAYHTPTTIRVVGKLDLDVLDRVTTELCRRHAIFRTTYVSEGGEQWQVVHPPEPQRVERHDLTELPEPERTRRAGELVRRELHRPFDTGRLPLLRWTAIQLAPDEHEIVLVEHHLVHDGWSFALLMRELKALYNAFAAGRPSPLPEPSLQYHDYAVWQRKELTGSLSRQLAYWRDRLAGLPEPLTITPDRPRPQVQTFAGNTLRIELPPGLPRAVREFCQVHRVTLFTAMYAAFVALMHRLTAREDVCVGSAFACRQVPGATDIVGMFVNPVLLRCQVRHDLPFREVVHAARDAIAGAAQNQEYPFPDLVRAVNPGRDPSGQPMMQMLFSANDSPLPDLDLAGATGTVFERGNGSAKMDIDVVVVPRAESQTGDSQHADERVMLMWEYNADLYDESTMVRMADRYLRLLGAAVHAPTTPVGELPLLSEDERQLVLSEWNDAPGEAGEFSHAHHRVLKTAASAPERIAVADNGMRIDYATLAERAGRLAGHLQRLGVRPGELVGLLLPRGIGLAVAELGVLLAGAAFAPLDPAAPTGRIEHCCRDGGIRFVVVSEPSANDAYVEVAADPGADCPQWMEVPVHAEDPAYVIFTSGSTGRPKGVAVSHRNLANLIDWYVRKFTLTAADRVAMVASPGFDTSISELWPAMVTGASLHVPSDETRLVPARMRDWLCRKEITIAELPTPLAEAVLALDWPGETTLRALLTGGDRLTVRPDPALPFPVFNTYGPTETTVDATVAVVAPAGAAPLPPSIGRPVGGARAYLLDRGLSPVAPGSPGELYIGGPGVAIGYAGRADLTADRFVPDPFAARPGQRMYRTGDICRHRRDGRLEFLGRTDEQIKLRGFRIEPAEIVAVLLGCPGVTQAHVVARDARLVGYLVGAGTPNAELRRQLAATLPDYMIPSAFVWLDELPMTINGKVDRAALPAPPAPATVAQVPARSAVEKQLASIWRDVLRLERVGIHDNFFDLGGHSLLLGAVHERITTELRADLPMVALFQYSSIGALARYLEAGEQLAERTNSRLDARARVRNGRARRLAAGGVGGSS